MLAAEAMRQILVDHARAKAAVKRGGGGRPESLDDLGDADEPSDGRGIGRSLQLRVDPVRLLAINEALDGLEKLDARAAAIVKMRMFAGMNPDEIAALLGASRRTVERGWRYAMAELRVRLSEVEGDREPGSDDADERPHDDK
jgi:RNA polymerase sigma factor (sigma-70 family)